MKCTPPAILVWTVWTLAPMLAGAPDPAISTFEDLTLPAESCWNGADNSGGFHSGDAFFGNTYTIYGDVGFWDGFAYSNRTDAQIEGVDGQYSAIVGSGEGGSTTYGVAFVGWAEPPTITLGAPQILHGLYVTNNNFAYYSIRDGSLFAKKFGGPTGNDPDWFKLSITGKDAAGSITGTVDFYLADFRFADNAEDYILNSWAFVNLAPLGEIKTLQLRLDSSDKGLFGMNTPSYVCIDTIVPQPPIATFDDLALAPESHWNGSDGAGGFTSGDVHFKNSYDTEWDFWQGFAYSNGTDANLADRQAQYHAIPGCGQGGSANYGVVFVGWEAPPTLTPATPRVLSGLYVANNSYAYYDMRRGSGLSKKFGGPTGNDEDWLKLTITGADAAGHATGTVDFYLADFRFADNAKDYILDSWAFVNLTALGQVQALQFSLASSDNGPFGMNTPSYVCIDTIVPVTNGAPAAAADQTDPEEQRSGTTTTFRRPLGSGR